MSKPADELLEEGPSFSLERAYTALRKRLWIVVSIAVAVPLLVGFVVSKQPKEYEARTTLVVDSSVPQYMGQTFRDVVDIGNNWWTAQETLQTELKVLASYSQALATAEAMCRATIGPQKEPAFPRFMTGGDCGRLEDVQRAAFLVQALVRAEPVKESRIVYLVAANSDAEVAAVLANTMAGVYTERNLNQRLSQSEGAANWLGDEYGDLSNELNAAERALIEFKRKNNVVAVAIEDQQNDLSTHRKKLSEELSTVQVKLIAVRATRDQYTRLKSPDPLNSLSESPVLMKLKELYLDQYAKLLELRGKYLDKHPAVVAQEARVNAIRDDLQREASQAEKSAEAQYQALLEQEKSLRAALDSATRDSLQLEQRAIEYNRLKRNLDRLSKLSEQVGGRERETSLAGHLKTNNVRVLDGALVPTAAIAPNMPRAVAMAAVVGLLLAIGVALLLELLDSTVKSQEDIEKSLALSFLGLIPTITTDSREPNVETGSEAGELARPGSKDLWVLTHPKSAVAECCRSIRTNLLFMTPDKPAKTLLITSAGPMEGKTTTALSLAITMAQSGLRVLLVDTDMRRPRLHHALGVPTNIDGLSRAIVGEADAREMVRDTGIPNLWLLPCGATPPNPAELLHADRFKRIIEELSEAYDRVIFDSPPIGAVTDAAILSRLTAGTVLVAKAGRTSKDALIRAKRHLGEDVSILGCILNDVDLARQGRYYHSYPKYGYYYGHDGRAAGKAVNQSSGG